jgi:uncharacterized membrane protein
MVVLSLGEFLWSLLVIFFMVIYFMMLFQVIIDVFRRSDASGGKKALWLIFLLIAPAVGLIAYLITNSQGMAERAPGYAGARGYGGGSEASDPTAQITRAKSLLDSGAITQDEYNRLKAQALA